MGLDMYLTREIYLGAQYDHNKITGSIDLYKGGKKIEINLKKVGKIVEDAAYWRKANQIHKWFVDNIQNGEDDCGKYYVSNEQIQELIDSCKKVLADHSLAETLLPPQSGFFFGGTELDEYYFEELQDTINQLEPLLEDEQNDFYYSSSW